MSLKWPSKDPDEVLDYGIDWAGTAGKPGPLYGLTDVISNSLWIVPNDITKEQDSYNNTSTTIWLSGGITGEIYAITNRITTSGGRVFDQTVKLSMKDH
jgi:hypothetical protein